MSPGLQHSATVHSPVTTFHNFAFYVSDRGRPGPRSTKKHGLVIIVPATALSSQTALLDRNYYTNEPRCESLIFLPSHFYADAFLYVPASRLPTLTLRQGFSGGKNSSSAPSRITIQDVPVRFSRSNETFFVGFFSENASFAVMTH